MKYLLALILMAFASTHAHAFVDMSYPTKPFYEKRHVAHTYVKAKKHTKRSKRSRAITKYARRSGGASISCLSPRAKALWRHVTAVWGPMQVISTCRPGATVRRTGRPSRHASGNAIDFRAPKGRKAAVVEWLIRNHRSGGVMTYRNHGHIHIDIGPQFVALGARG